MTSETVSSWLRHEEGGYSWAGIKVLEAFEQSKSLVGNIGMPSSKAKGSSRDHRYLQLVAIQGLKAGLPAQE